MNLDFHYYGTYMAACEAGFAEDEALKIAEAAQMVDDCTQSLLEKKGKYKKDSTITCESFMESMKDINENFFNANDKELSRIQKIWMPFHFLPGNLEKKIEYGGKKEIEENIFNEERDQIDFECMCVPNSMLVQKMLDETMDIWKKMLELQSSNNTIKNNALALIGVRMHVLADTWAHEFFTGTPNYWINNASHFEKLDGSTITMNEMGTFASSEVYSIHYLGHGRAGHYPDYGYLSYSYQPQWAEDKRRITKNNPFLFQCAYAQMVDAMSFIKHSNEDGRYQIKSDNDLYKQFQTLQKANVIKGVIKTSKNDQSDNWNKIAKIREYKKENVDIDAFQTGANLHFLFVKKELSELGIPYLE